MFAPCAFTGSTGRRNISTKKVPPLRIASEIKHISPTVEGGNMGFSSRVALRGAPRPTFRMGLLCDSARMCSIVCRYKLVAIFAHRNRQDFESGRRRGGFFFRGQNQRVFFWGDTLYEQGCAHQFYAYCLGEVSSVAAYTVGLSQLKGESDTPTLINFY